MEIILKENYPSLGYVGDRVQVRGGFARNFLIPRGIAVEASTRNERLLKHKMTAITAKRVKLRAEAEAFAQTISGISLSFTLKAASAGKSFGSIGVRDILNAFAEKNVQLDKRQIRLADVIRTAGEYEVDVKLHSEVSAKVQVQVAIEKPLHKEPRAEKQGRNAAAVDDSASEQSDEADETVEESVQEEE